MDFKKLHTKPKEKRLDLLFKTFGKQLFGYGHQQWKIPKDACWDLVYACLYKVEERVDTVEFESEEKFKSYVFRIFINRMKNYLRDEKVRTKGNREVELEEERLIERKDTEESETEEIQILNNILDQLKDWQRILMLMRAQDYSYADISKYTHQSEKNLKVYYGRLKKKIAKEMELKLQNMTSYEK
ncbi:MAG: sigma-70 family RNA polymerase sigma factor [Flavobacteriales bacterium]|nr:sigma-70 family RNA polymerase sigma factor [Flavobacteriales bacterium]